MLYGPYLRNINGAIRHTLYAKMTPRSALAPSKRGSGPPTWALIRSRLKRPILHCYALFCVVVMMITALWIFKTIPIIVCPAGHRFPRGPPFPPRLRDRATPPPHSSPRCSRRTHGRRRPTRRVEGVERCPSGDGLLDD